ncbi:unnamed protein product [Hyaloperonospora brassicae]|uniref:Uncharacterized protein n=1 Tax=Hyaloperonospora brassicae TaxID=162125 RepID=A0AAV0T057_HYABA|nr:unnamed protein product [Hyaloperonospora brassicae]
MAAAPASSDALPSDDEEVTTAEFSVDLADSHTWSINFYECASEGDLECLEEILDSGHVAVNDVDVDGFTALMVAAAEGHADVVRALLRRGAEVSMRTYELRSSALHFAAKKGNAEVMTALCSCDATVVDCWNIHADTPLIWACLEGQVEAVKVLLDHGADVGVLNQYGASTVLCAVMIGEDLEQEHERDEQRAEILTMLLEKNGKLVNFQDREGSSAMHLAASCGYLACVKTLLAFGADITLRNASGQTPLEEAQDSELPGSSACVEHLRGIWRQLEEEAAVRMMAMLEMEEDAASGTAGAASNKKSKKKSKKAKRKTAGKQQQQLAQQEVELSQRHADNIAAQQRGSGDDVDKAATSELVVEDLSSGRDRDSTAVGVSATEVKDDEISSVSSEDAPIGDQVVVMSPESDGDREGHAVKDGIGLSTSTMDEQPDQATRKDLLPSTTAWTTVGKKHRPAIAAMATTPAKASASSLREKTLSIPARRRNSAAPLCSKPLPHTSRRKPTHRPDDARERSSSGGPALLAKGHASTKQVDALAHPSIRSHVDKWGKWSSVTTASQSVAPLSQLNPDAISFGSLGPTTGSIKTSSVSSTGASSLAGLSIASASLRRPFFSSSHAPHTSAFTTGMHYSPAGRRTWKQHRSSGVYQVAHETRDRWVSKLHLSNESVAETLGYLACGLCGELVNDNLQCSGSASRKAGEKTSTCTQLYCASCLECSAFRAANSVTFKCIKCHEVITKESMARNSLAQAQAASLGLSMSTGLNGGAHDDAASYTLENMQHTLEMSGPRVSAVDLRAFFLAPGTDLTTLSNGQLEVLECSHQLALAQITEQRLANARALERLQMEEWLKMRQNLLPCAPR